MMVHWALKQPNTAFQADLMCFLLACFHEVLFVVPTEPPFRRTGFVRSDTSIDVEDKIESRCFCVTVRLPRLELCHLCFLQVDCLNRQEEPLLCWQSKSYRHAAAEKSAALACQPNGVLPWRSASQASFCM